MLHYALLFGRPGDAGPGRSDDDPARHGAAMRGSSGPGPGRAGPDLQAAGVVADPDGAVGGRADGGDGGGAGGDVGLEGLAERAGRAPPHPPVRRPCARRRHASRRGVAGGGGRGRGRARGGRPDQTASCVAVRHVTHGWPGPSCSRAWSGARAE